jgi:hypothetical protein
MAGIVSAMGMFHQQFLNEGCATLPSCPSGELVPGTRSGSGAESFDSLHVENYAVFLLNIAAHISATEVGLYVRQNKEPSGRRSSPSLECSLLPGLRGHQQ